jgi:hypothetical protein
MVASMFDSLIHGIVLNAKAKTGADEEFFAWTLAGAVFGLIAVMFFSLAAYVWLAGLYGGALGGLAVAGIHLAMAAVVVAKSIAVRRRNRQLAQAQIDLAAKQPAWRLDPVYVAMGVEIVKIIGVRNLVPLAAAGLLAVGWSATRGKPAGGRPH